MGGGIERNTQRPRRPLVVSGILLLIRIVADYVLIWEAQSIQQSGRSIGWLVGWLVKALSDVINALET